MLPTLFFFNLKKKKIPEKKEFMFALSEQDCIADSRDADATIADSQPGVL